MLKTAAFGLGFQHLTRDLANANAWKTMFDPYIGCYRLYRQTEKFLIRQLGCASCYSHMSQRTTINNNKTCAEVMTQISLRLHTVWSESSLIACVLLYVLTCAGSYHSFPFSLLKRGIHFLGKQLFLSKLILPMFWKRTRGSKFLCFKAVPFQKSWCAKKQREITKIVSHVKNGRKNY